MTKQQKEEMLRDIITMKHVCNQISELATKDMFDDNDAMVFAQIINQMSSKYKIEKRETQNPQP